MPKGTRRQLRFENLENRTLLSGVPLHGSDSAAAVSASETAAWHNQLNPVDVNGDSFVSPIDALLIIDHLNAYPGIFELSKIPAVSPPYLDSNHDGFVTPVDALLVINFLNDLGDVAAEPIVSQTYRLDFGAGSSPVKEGMLRVTPAERWGPDQDFGFISTAVADPVAAHRDGMWGDHSGDFVQATRITFALRLTPHAVCHLRIGMGDPLRARSQTITIDGVPERWLSTSAGELRVAEYDVRVPADGILRIVVRSTGSDPAVVNFLVARASPRPAADDVFVSQCDQDRPDWMKVFPANEAPDFDSERYPISFSQQFRRGTDWRGLDERQVFADRVSVTNADQQPQYEFRLGQGSQLYSLRQRDSSGDWVEAIATQGNPAVGSQRNSEWVDEVIQTVIVDGELNDRSRQSTKNQIHQAGTYRGSDGTPTFYSPVLDRAWLPEERTLATIAWPQQARVPSIYQSHFLLLQQIRDLGSGVLEVTYVYHNFSQNGEKSTYLAAPWLPIRDSSFPYQFRSLPDGSIQRDQRSWCTGGSCTMTSEPIRNSDGFFLFSSGTESDDAALAIVFGVDARDEGQTAPTRFRWGTVTTNDRDLTAAALQKWVRIEPGQVFYHRYFLVANSLRDSAIMARQLQSYVSQGFLTTDAGTPADSLLVLKDGQIQRTGTAQSGDHPAQASSSLSKSMRSDLSDCGQPQCPPPPGQVRLAVKPDPLPVNAREEVLSEVSSTPRTGWQPLIVMVVRDTGKRIVTNDPYRLLQHRDRTDYDFDSILGWISPAEVSQLTLDADSDVADLLLINL